MGGSQIWRLKDEFDSGEPLRPYIRIICRRLTGLGYLGNSLQGELGQMSNKFTQPPVFFT